MIKLRDFSENDISSIARFANNANVSNYLTSSMPYPYTTEDAKWWVEIGSKEGEVFKAIDLNGECVGSIGVHRGITEHKFSGEIGFWLAEEYWGQGYTTEAVSKMTSYIFNETDIVRLYARVFSPNKASMLVLEKCGYVLEGILKKEIFKNGEFYDDHIYGKTNS